VLKNQSAVRVRRLLPQSNPSMRSRSLPHPPTGDDGGEGETARALIIDDPRTAADCKKLTPWRRRDEQDALRRSCVEKELAPISVETAMRWSGT
jgi:hypothetical protein